MTQLPAPAPPRNPETNAFWEATGQHLLLLPRCESCGRFFWYPRGVCPLCGSAYVAWVESSGVGTIYSYTVTRRGTGSYEDVGAYILAYVELSEGPRIMTNIVECSFEDLFIGQEVSAVFHDTSNGGSLLRFRPAAAG